MTRRAPALCPRVGLEGINKENEKDFKPQTKSSTMPSSSNPPATSDEPDASGWSAAQYNKHAAFVYSPTFTAPVLEMLACQPGEKIIDFGCGSGELALAIEQIVSQKEGGMVAAFDYSESMVRPSHFRQHEL